METDTIARVRELYDEIDRQCLSFQLLKTSKKFVEGEPQVPIRVLTGTGRSWFAFFLNINILLFLWSQFPSRKPVFAALMGTPTSRRKQRSRNKLFDFNSFLAGARNA